jgi:hypothetical protein
LDDEDLQPEILEIVEPLRSPFDDGDLGLVLNDGFACRIGEPGLAVVHDPVERGRDGLDHRVEWCNVCFFNVREPPFQPLQRKFLVSFLEDVERLLFQPIRLAKPLVRRH